MVSIRFSDTQNTFPAHGKIVRTNPGHTGSSVTPVEIHRTINARVGKWISQGHIVEIISGQTAGQSAVIITGCTKRDLWAQGKNDTKIFIIASTSQIPVTYIFITRSGL